MNTVTYRYPIDSKIENHPRFLLKKDDIKKIKDSLKTSEWGKLIAKRVIFDADELLTAEPLTRIQEGRRILDISRAEIYRTSTLATAYIITDNIEYANRAIKEMLAIAKFTDWNPSHFLDVAEMNMAMSIGYDWLYNVMSDEDRKTIHAAIVEKGIMPSQSNETGFFEGTNNWTQVCNGGTIAGALVSDDADLRCKVIERAMNALPKVMNISYRSNGSYPEGSSYWVYGTEYNVLTIMGLESTINTDFGLSDQAKFSKTANFHTAVIGDSGIASAFSDDALEYPISFINLFFAKKFNNNDLITSEYKKQIKKYMNDFSPEREKNRFLPLSVLFLDILENSNPKEMGDNQYFSGYSVETPISVYRKNENDNKLYLLIKGGSPHSSHAHMDGGSFVLEFNGVRFCEDLGKEDYNRLESAGFGMDLWTSVQSSKRWSAFKLGNNSHNLLLINKADLLVDGRVFMDSVTENQTVMNLTNSYDNRGDVKRTFDTVSTSEITITDSVPCAKANDVITFQIVTKAKATKVSNTKLELAVGNDKIEVVVENGNGDWEIIKADDLMQPYDTPEPDVTIVRYNSTMKQDGAYLQTFILKK